MQLDALFQLLFGLLASAITIGGICLKFQCIKGGQDLGTDVAKLTKRYLGWICRRGIQKALLPVSNSDNNSPMSTQQTRYFLEINIMKDLDLAGLLQRYGERDEAEQTLVRSRRNTEHSVVQC